jgi:type IV pilus assembly protein PilY1
MKRRYLILSMILCLMFGTVSGFAMECETPPFVTQAVEPNILIIFDNSGSMATEVWIDSYNRNVDHSEWRLPATGNQVIFAKDVDCYIDHNRVSYVSSQGKVRLKYKKAANGSQDICSGGTDADYITQWSETDGYFYFDRQSGTFIAKSAYQSANKDHVKIFLPYATYSVDPSSSTGSYTTWYDYDYMNWLFYDSTPADRDALKQQHDDPNQRALLTRILVAKKVVKDLVETTSGVRFGFMVFTGSKGGSLEAEVTSDKQSVLAAIGDADKSGVWATGSTPLAETLEDAWEYFSGAETGSWGTADSPVQYWCQKNFIILMTDGYPSLDADGLGPLKGDWDNDHGGGSEENLYHGEGSDYLDDIAYYIHENDFTTKFDGKQNIFTYTIGFTIVNPLLKDTAFNGNGLAGLQSEWDNPTSPHYHRYFYTAKNYIELEQALNAAFIEIINRISSGTAVAVQSTSTEGQRKLLRAKFLPKEWRGYLEAFKLPYSQGDHPVWEAGMLLKDRDVTTRYIFTAVDDKTGPAVEMKGKLEFTEANSATTIPDNNKLSDMLGAVDDAEAKKIIRYIRGGGVDGYRDRKGWKLGDIAYSTPIISGDMAFVGANDGMLHAFDINTGEEKWAFIPNNLLPKLKDLTLMDYCHEYFVDLAPKVTEVFVGGTLKKILVGGERGGGNSFFALDITDSSATGVQPLWEFSDPYLGESWTIPTIEKCFLGGQKRLVAFIGSAYGNKDTKGYLFAVDVLTGKKMGTQLCLTGAPDNVLPSLRAIDWDQDGYADRIFVGCLQEKLFVVEIGPGADPKFWKFAHIMSTDPGQPISVSTSLSLYREGGQDFVMSYFGTGKFYSLADKTDLTLQTFYAVKDNAVKVGKGGLADQTNADLCADLLGGFGWYIDLVEGPGERVVSSSLVVGGYVFFTTFQPDDDPCAAGGIARLYIVGYENGCVPDSPVIDVNGDGVVDENDKIGGKIPRTITIGYGIPSDIIFDPAESSIIIQTSDTTIHVFKVDVLSNRLTVHSWREVLD